MSLFHESPAQTVLISQKGLTVRFKSSYPQEHGLSSQIFNESVPYSILVVCVRKLENE